MKVKRILMMLWVAIVALSMTMVSCTANEDNEVTLSPEEQEGVTMPENAFLKVPAVAGDQNVINALKSIDKVTDVKAFNLVVGYDYWALKEVTKTAYYFNYKQDIDHNDPSMGWFKQQCVLTVAGKDRPTVLHTEGYALDHNNINQID